jgi:TolB-like protein
VKLFSEIKRRQVVQAAVAYAVVGWLLIQLAIALEASLELPSHIDRWVTVGVIAGFPAAILLAWLFDISLSGIRLTPETNQKATSTEAASKTAAPPPQHSIAVLPFADMSPDGDQEYLGDGVAEEILNALVKVTPLRVSGRTSSFSFKGKDDDIQSIGETLNVAHVLEGSVRKQGDRVRITAQLIQVSDGFHMWSEAYDGDLKDIFDLQDTISKKIVSELEVLLDADSLRLAVQLTSNLGAYESFLKGRDLMMKQDRDGALAKSISYLEHAVQLDRNFAEAWAMLARAHFLVLEHTKTATWQNHIDLGKDAARRGIELKPDNVEVLIAKSGMEIMSGEYGKGFETAIQTLEKFPTNATVKYLAGARLNSIGLYQDGTPLMSEAIEEDPLAASYIANAAFGFWMAGQTDKSVSMALQSYDLGYFGGAFNYAWILSNTGDVAKAVKFMMKNGTELGPLGEPIKRSFARRVYSSAVYHKSGFWRFVVKLIVKRRYMSPKTQPSNACTYNPYYLGDTDWFFKAVRQKPHPYVISPLTQIWTNTPEALAIRKHEDFPQFAEDMGFVKLWRAYGWPKQVQPNPGTNGSNLQFTVS